MNFFEDDIDPLTLPSEPSIISSICKDGNLAHFDDVLSILIALSTNGRLLMENIINIVKFMLVNGGTGMGLFKENWKKFENYLYWVQQEKINQLFYT